MRMGNKGPHGRPWIWLMAVIVICLAPVMDPIAADITVTALAVWGDGIQPPLTAQPAAGRSPRQAPCSEKSRLDTRLHPIIGHGL